MMVTRHRHLSDLGLVTQRNCTSSVLQFSLLVVHMESKILKEKIPNCASFFSLMNALVYINIDQGIHEGKEDAGLGICSSSIFDSI